MAVEQGKAELGDRQGGTRTERTRRAIMAAAEEAFLAHGFTGTSMDEVATMAAVSKQTVYAHFRSKDVLFVEVVGGMTGAAGDEVLEQAADPVDDRPVEAFLLDYADSLLDIVVTPRLMRLRRLVIGEVERFPDLARVLHERGPQRSIGRLKAACEHYVAAGQLTLADARQAASFFNWLVMGEPVNDAMLLGDAAAVDPARLRAHAREAVRIFLAAYGTDADGRRWEPSRLNPP